MGVNGSSDNEHVDWEAPALVLEKPSKDGIKSLEDAVKYRSVSGEAEQPMQSRKPNRQKARLARRAAEQEAAVAEAANEAASLPDRREQERLVMQKELKARGLQEKDIRPDGHCLYSAIADQLTVHGVNLASGRTLVDQPDYKVVRQVAADFIAKNPDDFSPFLVEPLEDYIVKVRVSAEWGGQLELSALARAYSININVLQGDGRVEKIDAGTDAIEKPIWLAYYRHAFGLGEHYNSLRTLP